MAAAELAFIVLMDTKPPIRFNIETVPMASARDGLWRWKTVTPFTVTFHPVFFCLLRSHEAHSLSVCEPGEIQSAQYQGFSAVDVSAVLSNRLTIYMTVMTKSHVVSDNNLLSV